jgi:ribosomal protein L12E/L44/L45/RPP1/RPP2
VLLFKFKLVDSVFLLAFFSVKLLDFSILALFLSKSYFKYLASFAPFECFFEAVTVLTAFVLSHLFSFELNDDKDDSDEVDTVSLDNTDDLRLDMELNELNEEDIDESMPGLAVDEFVAEVGEEFDEFVEEDEDEDDEDETNDEDENMEDDEDEDKRFGTILFRSVVCEFD